MSQYSPVRFVNVRLEGDFWRERLETVLTRTIPSQHVKLGEYGILGSLKLPQPPPPQGNPNAPHVGPAECNYSIDKQINLYSQRDPRIKAQLTSARAMALQQCLEKWTHDEYDCVVKAKTLEDLVLCKRFERP